MANSCFNAAIRGRSPYLPSKQDQSSEFPMVELKGGRAAFTPSAEKKLGPFG